MKLYLAGPMRGVPEFNFPEFHRVAALLRKEGHCVFNPAENDEKLVQEGWYDSVIDIPSRVCLGQDLAWLCKHAQGVALLDGWEKSKGALAERATAVALGLPAQHYTLYL